jgi:hypothetical protein
MTPARISRLLPAVFRQGLAPGGLLAGLIETMSGLHRPSEQALASLPATCDPRRAPERFVPFIARWVHFEHLCGQGGAQGRGRHRGHGGAPRATVESLGHQRELVANAAELAHWRGTRAGLLRFLRLATGLDGFEVEERVPGEDGRPRPFHLRVVAPAAAQRQRDLVQLVVRMAKPAHVTCDIHFA